MADLKSYRAKVVLHRPDVGGMETYRTFTFGATSEANARRKLEGEARSGGFSGYRVLRVEELRLA